MAGTIKKMVFTSIFTPLKPAKNIVLQHGMLHVDVFQSTLHIINQGVYISENGIKVLLRDYLNRKNINDNSFYISEIPAEFSWIKNKTKYEVVQQDCLELARTLKQKNNADDLAVLNMASASNPGGGVYGGAGAQEEYLFRCSDYYRFLFQICDAL